MTVTMTFNEFWNNSDVKTIWLTSAGSPGGIELTHNVDTDCEEDYCDLGEIVNDPHFDFIGDLEGEVENNRWEWNGEGDPRYLTNSVTQLVAYTMTNQTTIRETARESIEAEAQQAWEHVVDTPCYQWLMVNPDGSCWWSEQINKNNISEAEFNGDCPGYVRLQCFGTPGTDNGLSDFEQYETRKTNADELAAIVEYLDGEDETDIDIDGVTWRMDKHGDECGDAGSWYTVTDKLLAWNEGFWCDTSPGDIFETAIRVLSEIPFGFFDDETVGAGARSI